MRTNIDFFSPNHVSSTLSRNTIVVFDEAHNIDSVCVESLSVKLSNRDLDKAKKRLEQLQQDVASNRGFRESGEWFEGQNEDQYIRNQCKGTSSYPYSSSSVPLDNLHHAPIPGSIAQPAHFISALSRFIEYLRKVLKDFYGTPGSDENLNSFQFKLFDATLCDDQILRCFNIRLQKLVKALKLAGDRLDSLFSLTQVTTFASILGTYETGFRMLIENENNYPAYRLICTDPAIAFRPVTTNFKSIVITSGTLSPISTYKQILEIEPQIAVSINCTVARESIKPVIVTRGNDQVQLTSKFEARNDPSVVRNYGLLLIELSKVVPDGMIAFFASYGHLENCLSQWYEADGGGMRILEALEKQKLIFVEVPGMTSLELNRVMQGYKLACQSGHGALLFAVARGRVSEGIDFSGSLARAVVVLGMPFVNTMSKVTQARLRWIRDCLDIKENNFLMFDAARHSAQCLGRAIRGKDDYAMLILADKRFSRADRLNKLPTWLASRVGANKDFSIEDVALEARDHFRKMGISDEELKRLSKRTCLITEKDLQSQDTIKKCMALVTECHETS